MIGSRVPPRSLAVLLLVLFSQALAGSGRAATGTWLHFQTDATGYSGFGTACAIHTRRGQAVMFGMWNYPVCFGLNCTGYTNYDVTAFARFTPDPLVPPPHSLANSPPARSDACAAYDSLTDQVWLFGGRFAVDSLCTVFGCPARPSLDDPWRFNVGASQWQAVPVVGARPPARYGATMVVDPLAHRLLLFGGHDSTATAFGDLWSLPLGGPAAWTQLHPAGVGPSPRFSATALWDPAHARVLIVGGFDATGSVSEVWALNMQGPLAWSAVPVAGASPAGIVHALVDVRRDLLLAYAGPASIATCALSGTPTWTALDAPNGPATSSPGGFGYDPVHDAIWLPYAEATLPGAGGSEAQHWLLTLAQPPADPALLPMIDSVRYSHGFERQWWRPRAQRTGYDLLGVQMGADDLATWGTIFPTQPAPDTTAGEVMTGLIARPPGQVYGSRIFWTEGPFEQIGGAVLLHAPVGPVAMSFTTDSVSFANDGVVHVVWRAANDSLSLLTPFFVERQDASGWVAVLNDWPDAAQRIVLNETLASDVSTANYRIRWDGPNGTATGGDLHAVRDPAPPPAVSSLFLAAPRPNPASDVVLLDYRLVGAASGNVGLFDVRGRRVREWSVAGGSAQSYPLDVRGIRSGLYVLRLEQHSRSVAVRVVIVR